MPDPTIPDAEIERLISRIASEWSPDTSAAKLARACSQLLARCREAERRLGMATRFQADNEDSIRIERWGPGWTVDRVQPSGHLTAGGEWAAEWGEGEVFPTADAAFAALDAALVPAGRAPGSEGGSK